MRNYLTSQMLWGLFGLALGLSALLTPLAMRLARRLGAVDRGGYRKLSTRPIPLMGGLGVAAPLLLFCLAVVLGGPLLVHNWEWIWRANPAWLNPIFSITELRGRFLPLLVGALAILGLGMADDLWALRARTKLLVQVVVGVFLCTCGYAMTSIDLPGAGALELGLFWGSCLTVLWVVGVTNAFNLIDGVDGLAAGIALIGAAGFSVLAGMMDNYFVLLTTAVFMGSLLAFLGFNFPPARVFLGDTGSLFIGYTMAALALIGNQKSQTVLILSPVLVLGLPILETLLSMARRVLHGRPLFAPDARHTHHRLFLKGYSPRATVLILYSVSAAMAFAAVMQRVLPPESYLTVLPPLLYAVSILGVGVVAGYGRSLLALRERLARREDNSRLWSLSRYASLTLSAERGPGYADDILRVVRKQARLGFLEARQEEDPSPIGSSGTPSADAVGKGAIRRLEVRGANGRPIVVRFQFDHDPTDVEVEDVSACLARVFEHARLRTALAGAPGMVSAGVPFFRLVDDGKGRRRKRVMNVVGTRPNFIKIAPLMEAFRACRDIEPILVHTGQHYDEQMSALFFRQLGIPQPDVNLDVRSGTHAVQTAEIMRAFEPVVLQHQPDAVLVVGDVNSTVACGLVAVKLGVPLIHVEAGLRSFDKTMPEEVNRILIDTMSDLLFCTEQSGVDNLLREGIAEDKIHFVGNVMIDTLLRNREKARDSKVLDTVGVERGRYATLTLHRPSNVDNEAVLGGILSALEVILRDMPVVFPVHPRTRKRIEATVGLQAMANMRLTDPLGYLDFLELMASSRLVLTDSGGVQEETTILKVPCLTLRENTERPVTIEVGTNQLVGTKPERIVAAYRSLSTDRRRDYEAPPLWDGKAAHRIVDVLKGKL